MPEASLAGKLLVANPQLSDPNFDRTVVLVLVHGDDGALGVVLNRPSDTEVAAPLPGWADLVTPPAVLFVGGPVSHDSVICLARVPDPARLEARAGTPDMWRSVAGDLGTLDLDVDPVVAGDGTVTAMRIFAGYSGWAASQMEGELLAGGWWVLDAAAPDPFAADPGALWHDVLRRQPGELSLVAAYPPDPEVN
jgi:putative transcriptional regulator